MREVGHVDQVRIGLVGDLANGRTARSLAYLLSMYKGIKMYFVAPDVVRLGNAIKDYLTSQVRHCITPTQLFFCMWVQLFILSSTHDAWPKDGLRRKWSSMHLLLWRSPHEALLLIAKRSAYQILAHLSVSQHVACCCLANDQQHAVLPLEHTTSKS